MVLTIDVKGIIVSNPQDYLLGTEEGTKPQGEDSSRAAKCGTKSLSPEVPDRFACITAPSAGLRRTPRLELSKQRAPRSLGDDRGSGGGRGVFGSLLLALFVLKSERIALFRGSQTHILTEWSQETQMRDDPMS